MTSICKDQNPHCQSQNSISSQWAALTEKKLVQMFPLLSILECAFILLLEHMWFLNSMKRRFSVENISSLQEVPRSQVCWLPMFCRDYILGTRRVCKEFTVLSLGPWGMTGNMYVLSKDVFNNRTHLSSHFWASL